MRLYQRTEASRGRPSPREVSQSYASVRAQPRETLRGPWGQIGENMLRQYIASPAFVVALIAGHLAGEPPTSASDRIVEDGNLALCFGDANADGRVDLTDLSSVLFRFGELCALKLQLHPHRDLTHSYTFSGDNAGDQLGFSVGAAGDVNNDGFPDFIVGAPYNDHSGVDNGSAHVFSGRDGSVLFDFYGDTMNGGFGWSVSAAGDVNADGHDDVVVGAPFANGSARGGTYVLSGADGSMLFKLVGESAGDNFGWSVDGAGDVNQDGFDDIIIGIPLDDEHGDASGSAIVVSGRDGSTLYTLRGNVDGDEFGISVSAVGDINNDGFADVVVGAHASDGHGASSGSARVFSGADGAVIYTFEGDSAGDRFGISVSSAGDVDGDGVTDIIVGAHFDDNNGDESGSARVFSGIDGSMLFTLEGDGERDFFGYSVSGAGDVNDDGFADVIVGAYDDDNNGVDSGSARVFLGPNGAVLCTFVGDSPSDFFGNSVSGAGDVNNDGYADLIVGALGDDNNGTYCGSARLIVSGSLSPCIGDANGDGLIDLEDLNAVLAAFGTKCSEYAEKLAARIEQ